MPDKKIGSVKFKAVAANGSLDDLEFLNLFSTDAGIAYRASGTASQRPLLPGELPADWSIYANGIQATLEGISCLFAGYYADLTKQAALERKILRAGSRITLCSQKAYTQFTRGKTFSRDKEDPVSQSSQPGVAYYSKEEGIFVADSQRMSAVAGSVAHEEGHELDDILATSNSDGTATMKESHAILLEEAMGTVDTYNTGPHERAQSLIKILRLRYALNALTFIEQWRLLDASSHYADRQGELPPEISANLKESVANVVEPLERLVRAALSASHGHYQLPETRLRLKTWKCPEEVAGFIDYGRQVGCIPPSELKMLSSELSELSRFSYDTAISDPLLDILLTSRAAPIGSSGLPAEMDRISSILAPAKRLFGEDADKARLFAEFDYYRRAYQALPGNESARKRFLSRCFDLLTSGRQLGPENSALFILRQVLAKGDVAVIRTLNSREEYYLCNTISAHGRQEVRGEGLFWFDSQGNLRTNYSSRELGRFGGADLTKVYRGADQVKTGEREYRSAFAAESRDIRDLADRFHIISSTMRRGTWTSVKVNDIGSLHFRCAIHIPDKGLLVQLEPLGGRQYRVSEIYTPTAQGRYGEVNFGGEWYNPVRGREEPRDFLKKYVETDGYGCVVTLRPEDAARQDIELYSIRY